MLAAKRPPMHAIRRRHVCKLGMAAVCPLGMDACLLALETGRGSAGLLVSVVWMENMCQVAKYP